MKTFHIHIKGIVQGIGFRPYVYQFCTSKNLKGWVNNTTDGVHIQINLLPEKTEEIVKELIANVPPLAHITSTILTEVAFKDYTTFKIISSESNQKPTLLLTPDYATCDACSTELFTEQNRRSNYPFITCTYCGPRYSIVKKLPYDRENTSMNPFVMCPTCKSEYENPLDRRYFSQTNSCPNCAITMTLYEDGKIQPNFTAIDYIIQQWHKGKIIAIKGIGGYLLTCDATNSSVIKRLRILKNRPTKPFALMYHNLYELAEDVEMGIGEKLELESTSAPIVLLTVKKDRMTPIALSDIAPNLSLLGVMLPYTPLYKLLLATFKKPIVATSGNVSNATIIYEDNLQELTQIADIILSNHREIVIPQDDSIIRYSSIKSYRTVIRRSRGLAPSYINPQIKLSNKTILAMGALLKSTFALLHQKNIHVSQYLGNTDSLEAQENYNNTLLHFEQLFQPKTTAIVVDKHPSYFSTILGKELALKNNIKLIEVQHHKAHLFAVLGENNLLEANEKILGVIWDGTGLGDDGNIWGGEFFTYKKGKTERIHHLDEFPFILGDKLPKEPRISALVMSSSLKNNIRIKEKFSKTEWNIYQKLVKSSSLKSTSIGRLFDAVASIILGIDKQTYEGEAAMQLESAAYSYFRAHNFTNYYSYLKEEQIPPNFIALLLQNITLDLEKGFQQDFIAAKFHISLAHYITIIAKQQSQKFGIQKVVFSGGVFQNQWLVELILSFMDDDFELFFHKQLSPNDENISFGQLMYYLYHQD